MTDPGVRIRPVTPHRVADFEMLFSAKGCPGYCWCAPYRFEKAERMSKAEKREAMLQRAAEGTPIGVLAYDDGKPVGWCSVAPRSTFPKLARSTVMPEVDPEAWTITCFFVRRDHRGKGISKRLLDGALGYARSEGAHAVEAYPWDTAGVTSQHWGHSSLYAAAGFEREAQTRRWIKALGP